MPTAPVHPAATAVAAAGSVEAVPVAAPQVPPGRRWQVAGLPDTVGGSGRSTGGRLSPSRAADFKVCPLLFRFRAVDRLDESPSPPALRGTVVHAALDAAFDLPRPARTPQAVRGLLAPALDRVESGDPAVGRLVAELDRTALLDEAGALVDAWFALEDPTRFDPRAREQLVEAVLPGGLTLRGIVDRLDQAPDGSLRIVDYKTGAAPGRLFEQRALFQVKFYALVVWRSTGVAPAEVMLLYLASRERLRYRVDVETLPRFERQLPSLWQAVERAVRDDDFRPNPGRSCDWCDHRERCPAWGNPAPPLPADAVERLLGPTRPRPSGRDPAGDPAPCTVPPRSQVDDRGTDPRVHLWTDDRRHALD
jgi:putative RecB family exonuclease